MSDSTIINDMVFGIINLSDFAISIVNTPEFQRLRYVNRLSLVQYVYPSATHTVFMASIGRYHLARKLIESLKLYDSEVLKKYGINENDIKCVEVAALCSDIAVAPCRYFWKRYYDRKNETVNDIRLTKFIEVFDKLIENIDNDQIKEKLEILDKNFILNIISGERNNNKPKFLYQIVYNKETRMDVTMWESLCRDNILLGLRTTNFSVDVNRFIMLARIFSLKQLKSDDKEDEICYKNKESHSIIDAYRLWANVHETAYRHRVVEGIELLLFDLFKKNEAAISDYERDMTNKIDGDFFSLINKIDDGKRLFKRKLYFLAIEGFKYDNVSDEEYEKIRKKLRKLNKNKIYHIAFINKVEEMSVKSLKNIGYYYKHSTEGFYLTEKFYEGIEKDLSKHRILIYYTERNHENEGRTKIEKFLIDINWFIQNENSTSTTNNN